MNPYERWVVACETRDGVPVRDEAGELLNKNVFTISAADAEAAERVAWAAWALSSPTRPLVMRQQAAEILRLPVPTAADLSEAEQDRQNL